MELRAGHRESARRFLERAVASPEPGDCGSGAGPDMSAPVWACRALKSLPADSARAESYLEEAEFYALGRSTWHEVALTRQSLKDYGRALEILDELTAEYPHLWRFWSDRGVCEFLSGRTDAAVAHLRRAQRLDPSRAPPYLTLATIYSGQGRRDLARRINEQALANIRSGDPLRALVNRGSN
ncbi:MAG: tetratricopeptide repeat protein [Elusimicrobia bacterium]|nr:tetratricopeptide repeat protein [Elusimicrobiota bacterium]